MTAVHTVMKREKSIKAGMEEGTRASSICSPVIDNFWSNAIREAEETLTEELAESESNEKATIS